MSFKEVYIVRASQFLPNQPVANDEMESYLGMINGKPSRSKNIVLRNNGIKNRFYALEKGGKVTHNNAQLTAKAVEALFEKNPDEIKSVQLLTCGTSSPDQIMPSHGVMVHGCLPQSGNMEVVTPAGNCCSGMHALKYAYMSIKTGAVQNAVSTGSERVSGVMRANTFNEEAKQLAELQDNPIIGFEKEFLRWMLSDGAGAFLLSDKPNENSVSLRIDWIESMSFANKAETCMYMGGEKEANGELKGFAEFSPSEIVNKSIFSMKQDVKMLDKYIVALGFDRLKEILIEKGIKSSDIDYFFPHISSEFFRNKIAVKFEENGMGIPQEKWFTNLSEVGNIGAASIYLMVGELFNKGVMKKGQKLLLVVPESARFSYVFAMLTVC